MSRSFIAFVVVLIASATLSGVQAQLISQSGQGDPPIHTLITLTPPNEDGIVTMTGAPGAVFPNARVAIRNLYTEDVVYAQAGVTGAFRADIYGPGNTPFWISPAPQNLPPELQNRPGSLPGGPGTIIYGSFPETRTQTGPITQLVVDGDLLDWQAYPQASFADGRVRALENDESVYVGVRDLPAGLIQLQLIVTIDRETYELTLAPRGGQSATLRQIAPDTGDFGEIRVANAIQGSNAELRVRVDDIVTNGDVVTVNEIRALGDESVTLEAIAVDQTLEPYAESDGITRAGSQVGDDPARFTIGGAVAQGEGYWSARGRANTLTVPEGDEPLHLELDVTFAPPTLPEAPFDLRMVAQISLQPVVADTGDGATVVPGLLSNSGYSTLRTPSGLAIDNVMSEIPLGGVTAESPTILERDGTLLFPLTFALDVPDDVPPGIYVPVLRGYAELDETRIPWEADGVFGEGDGISRTPLTRLPITLSVGGTTQGRLLWTLFMDDASDGSRGVLADEDVGVAALSNRVRYNSPTYILPPTTGENGRPAGYPLEPYLPNQLPNAYGTSAAPLVPFLFPGGRLSASITRPDGTVDNLGSSAIVQNQLSSPVLDERQVFGSASPVDIYRLSTLNPVFNRYPFDEYGEYTIAVSGSLEDQWGNRYDGGGTYHLLIAEPLDVNPGVLPGTPFEVGDAFNPVVHVAPGVPADVTLTLRVYPLDGSAMRENVLAGRANRFGYFHSIEEVLRFDTPGEYTVDYEVRYTDTDGRLWAGSLRSAGVIADPETELVAHGARGLARVDADVRQAWYVARHYTQTINQPDAVLRPNLPYYSGDVAWIEDGVNGGLLPAFSVQDTRAGYVSWLLDALPETIAQRTAEDELPITLFADNAPYGIALADQIDNEAYTYFSATRPGVTGRQFVLGGDDPALSLMLDPDDRGNGQIGAGLNGALPGDYFFLFGGEVIRNEAAGIEDTAIYASVAAVIGEDDERGPRVYPPYRGEAGGGDGGPLLTVLGEDVTMFFHPTGAQPGEVLIEGDVLTIAGQVAPTLPSTVSVTVTSPSGALRQFDGTANAIGYFYDPAQDFAVDEVGLWTVDVVVTHEGTTSAGIIEPPAPAGGILGAQSGQYTVYVVPQNATRIPLERTDIPFPAASRYNFTFPTPETWTDIDVFYTVTMPGYVLAQGTLPVTGRSFTYAHDPIAINRLFPNFDVQPRTTGADTSDPLTLTFTVTGTDENGIFQVASRKVTLFHDRLLSLED